MKKNKYRNLNMNYKLFILYYIANNKNALFTYISTFIKQIFFYNNLFLLIFQKEFI